LRDRWGDDLDNPEGTGNKSEQGNQKKRDRLPKREGGGKSESKKEKGFSFMAEKI